MLERFVRGAEPQRHGAVQGDAVGSVTRARSAATPPSLADAAQSRLLVRSLGGVSRVTYVSPELDVSLPIGGGPGDLFVHVNFTYAGELTSFNVPPDPFDGTDGWRVNDAARAVYLNRDAPLGPTDVRKTVIRAGGRIKLVASSLGDSGDLIFNDPITGAIHVSYDVAASGSPLVSHCAVFAPDDCLQEDLNGGFKVVCSGTPDPGCTALSTTSTTTATTTTSTTIPLTCGDGDLDPGEQCDGGPACTSSCLQTIPDCCQGTGSCANGLGFSLNFYLMQWCMTVLPGSTPTPGGTCEPDGTCHDYAIDPVPVCCQLAGSCYESTASSTSGLWSFKNVCVGAQAGTVHVNAVCDAGGACQPQ